MGVQSGVAVSVITASLAETMRSTHSDPASQRFITTNSPIQRMGELDELDGPLLLLARGRRSGLRELRPRLSPCRRPQPW